MDIKMESNIPQVRTDMFHNKASTFLLRNIFHKSENHKPWLIVLDIDSTILYYDLILNMYFIRPFFLTFLRHFKDRCEFALWTKGSLDYVNMIGRDIKIEWLFLWCDRDCVFDTKPLDQITLKYPDFNQTNTIFIDDCPGNFTMNSGWFCVKVPPFFALGSDHVFEELKPKLEELMNSIDTFVISLGDMKVRDIMNLIHLSESEQRYTGGASIWCLF